MCELIGDPYESRKCVPQTMEHPTALVEEQTELTEKNTDKSDANETNANIPDYIRSSTDRATYKRYSKALTILA